VSRASSNLSAVGAGDATVAKSEPSGVRNVKSAGRTVELLEFLADRQNKAVRLRELSDALGVPKSSLYALLRTLISRGWVRTDASGTMFSIGIRALLVGTSYLDTDPFVRMVQSQISLVGKQLDETIHLGRLDGSDIVYLATHESSQYLRPHSRLGRRLPAYSTSLGKSLLAERDDADVDQHLPPVLSPLTEHTITDRDTLLTDLAETRVRGYAVDKQENTVGVECFGMALHYLEPATDAISCSVPLARLTKERQAEVLAGMHALRASIEQAAPRVTAVS
jgi:DNA-binding IclR family transcriptional regulator